MLALLLSLVNLTSRAPGELDTYLRIPDSSYRYQVDSVSGSTTTVKMSSQTWQGFLWKHDILYRLPKDGNRKGVAILYITGDGPRPGDYTDIALMSQSTGMPIAMLFDEPNQPLWGLKEDDLIAHTFDEYLKTGDATWPLLFPMAKAAVRAMDTVVDLTKSSENPIHSFVVTGASKRGWTTWMMEAAGDPRVIGIAPMVYDNLNIPAQMPHQIASWGAYSEMIKAYTQLGLQAKLTSKNGARLGQIVDPYSYRDRFHAPILVVKGSNDPYWTADAADEYYGHLTPPHWMFTVPNAGHTLGGGFQAAQSIGAFSRAIAGDFKLPSMDYRLQVASAPEARHLKFSLPKANGAIRLRAWAAESETTDFRNAKYKTPDIQGRTVSQVEFEIPRNKNVAVFYELDFKTPDGHEFGLSTPTRVFKKD